MNALVPCPGCQRHVRQREVSCPFCAVALELSDATAVLTRFEIPDGVPRARLGRAALFAFGATLAASLSTTACGGDDDSGSGGSGGSTGGGGGSGGSGATGGGGSGGTAGSATGGSSGSGSGGDAGNAAGGFAGNAAEYGGPPFDGG